MFFFGGKWMLQIIKSKTKAEVKVFQNEQEMTITKLSLYSVSSVESYLKALITVDFTITHTAIPIEKGKGP